MSDTTVNLTPQQAAAINERSVSIALSAGAGCGKTFVLTQRFLSLLETKRRGTKLQGSGDPLGGIVAITFTDRAAREMRDRIRAACHDRLTECEDDEIDHWLRIVRALDSARISTIHSFCASILRANAVAAAIDPQFGLLDRSTGDAFERKVVADTVFELLGRKDADCMELVLHYGLDRVNSLLRDLLPGRFQSTIEKFETHTPETLAEVWKEHWAKNSVPELMKRLLKSNTLMRLLELLQSHEPANKKMQERRALLLDRVGKLVAAEDPLPILAELNQAARVSGGGGKSAWVSEEVYNSVRKLMADFRVEVAKLIKTLDLNPNEILTAARFSVVTARVLRQLYSGYEEEKREAGVLDFDDLLLRTRNLLCGNDEVRERVRSGISYLLVDEFQDTDPVQAEIVRQLCGDKLGSGKLFLVGDAKQSIYRFRRADPAVFAELRKEIPEKGRLPLSTNFRSQPAVLNFVNCLFAPEMGETYESLQPHIDEQISPTPAIEFLFAGTEAKSVESEPSSNDNGKESAEERRTREANWIARRIASLLHDPTPRIRTHNKETGAVDKRCVQAGDIVILFRALSNVWLYEEALRAFDIPYYLVGGRAFYAQQEVFDLVNLCSYLNDADDQVSLAGVLRSPFFSVSDDTLFAMVTQAGTLSNALGQPPAAYLPEQQQSQWKHASTVLSELLDAKDQLPLAELLNLAIAQTGYDAALLAEFLGERKVANLRKLVDMARQFDRAGLYTIADFVARIRDSVIEQTDEELAATHAEKSDVVRLMTIHQSKGLEFPVVIVADLDAARHGGSDGAYFHPDFGPLMTLPRVHGEVTSNLGLKMHKLMEEPEDAAEITRLFYVAATRAADYLILSAALDGKKLHSPWMKLLAARFDLQSGLPAGDPYLGRLSLGNVDCHAIPEIRVHHQAPEFRVAGKSTRSPKESLGKLRELVETADSIELPETLRTIEPDLTSQTNFSVSLIERAVECFESEKPRTALSDFLDARVGEDDDRSNGDALELNQLANAATLGSLVHQVIERLDFADHSKTESVVSQVLKAAGERTDSQLSKVVKNRVHQLLIAPIAREIMNAERCHRELEFRIRWPDGRNGSPSVVIVGKIDCLMQGENGRWKLIDYKTGRPGRDLQATLKKYEIQLVLYALAAREMIGELPHSVEIIALGEELQPIALPLSENLISTTLNRINGAITRLRSS